MMAQKQFSPELSAIFDVLVIGAGLAGIGAAYWLKEKCPSKNAVILEARNNIGGTWDLFRYPGVRSDSDMFSFGYRFKPWKNPQSLSDGESILNYLKETVVENDIEKKILFNHKVIRADWSSKELCWMIDVQAGEEMKRLRAKFMYMCSGYYSYDEVHRPTFTREEDFKGKIIVPQFWPNEYDYSGKRIVIVGSGATAVTLVPNIAEKAAHVTMLQRSPTYVMNLPNRNNLFIALRKWVSDDVAYRITRRRNLLLGTVFYWACRAFPDKIKALLIRYAAKQLPPGYDVGKHFNPTYNPWDQRLCVVPDGDLFKSITSGKASVVTDEISHFTKDGISLKSGVELAADAIVLATGLKIKLLGGAQLSVDGKVISSNESMVYKGMMLSDVPNFAIAFGYTNASWTLKTDLTANYVCKLLNYMDRKSYDVVTPLRQKHVTQEPFMNFQSGYVQRANNILPKQGSKRPWRVYQNYFMDMLTIRYGGVADGILQFGPKK